MTKVMIRALLISYSITEVQFCKRHLSAIILDRAGSIKLVLLSSFFFSVIIRAS